MLTPSESQHQASFFGDDLLNQLDPKDPLIVLQSVIPWSEFERDFSIHYSKKIGAPAIPIRRLVGLLILKQLENLSDETLVLQWKRNPYYQAFCGEKIFKTSCHAMQLSCQNFVNALALRASKKYF